MSKYTPWEKPELPNECHSIITDNHTCPRPVAGVMQHPTIPTTRVPLCDFHRCADGWEKWTWVPA